MCPNLFNLVHEMGHDNCSQNAEHVTHSYYMHVNMSTFLSMRIWVHQQSNDTVCERHEKQLYKVLSFIMLPNKCYHGYIEEHFEDPSTYKICGPYGDLCSSCTCAYRSFSGDVSRAHLVGAFQAIIFDCGAVKAAKLVTFLTDKANMDKLKKTNSTMKAHIYIWYPTVL